MTGSKREKFPALAELYWRRYHCRWAQEVALGIRVPSYGQTFQVGIEFTLLSCVLFICDVSYVTRCLKDRRTGL